MRQPQHAAPSAPSSLPALTRVTAAGIGLVLVVGIAATANASRTPSTAKAPSAREASRLVADPALVSDATLVAAGSGLPRLESAPAVAAPAHQVKRPATTKRKAAVASHAVVRRWLPTGTGIWLHQWDRSNGGNAGSIVKRARTTGITTLFVRGWSKKDGYEAPRALRALLPATKGTNIKVVVWEFVYLKDPVAEARRLAAEARITVPGAPRVMAVAPDIETAAEGTAVNGPRVLLYMKTLRAALPRNVSILTTLPWPSEHRVGKFPYAAAVRYADAILPMTYWYNRSPAGVTAFSVKYLRRYHKPIMPVGQGYDGRLDAPWLPRANVGKQVGAFLVTAHRYKVRAVSLWSWQTAPSPVWTRLSRARSAFRAPVVRRQLVVVRPKPKAPATSTGTGTPRG